MYTRPCIGLTIDTDSHTGRFSWYGGVVTQFDDQRNISARLEGVNFTCSKLALDYGGNRNKDLEHKVSIQMSMMGWSMPSGLSLDYAIKAIDRVKKTEMSGGGKLNIGLGKLWGAVRFSSGFKMESPSIIWTLVWNHDV